MGGFLHPLHPILSNYFNRLNVFQERLTTVAHGLVVNHWRRRDIERAYLEALAARPAAVGASPEQRELVIEALERIAQLLDGLAPRTREIFLLSQLDGMKYPRIAEHLGVSVNVVQKAMLKALTHCYTALYD
jgi:RNA polymerase sigma-70 factor (ECF subfamily)